MWLFSRSKRLPPSSEGEGVVDNFSLQAQKVLGLARGEAERFNHNFIGTEHILLGLIRLGDGTAIATLGRLGIDTNAIRLNVEKMIGQRPNSDLSGKFLFTPRTKKALALAAKEAKSLGHNYCGTEHIFLGLIREGSGVAGRVLETFGLDTKKARQAVIAEIETTRMR
jgi:ATP-dependent Clp protease ATP-binding subunit ClpC